MYMIAKTATPPPQDAGLLSPSLMMGYWPCPWAMATLVCTISLETGWLSYHREIDTCECVCMCVCVCVCVCVLCVCV